jgi:hypothetical protein
MNAEIRRMKAVEHQIPNVLVRHGGWIHRGRVRVNLKRGVCIVVVPTEWKGPMLFEFMASAIVEAVNYGRVLEG